MIRILSVAFVLLLPLAAAAAEDALSPAANAAFLAANAAKPGTISRPSGLQYRVLRSGTGKRLVSTGLGGVGRGVKKSHERVAKLFDDTPAALQEDGLHHPPVLVEEAT